MSAAAVTPSIHLPSLTPARRTTRRYTFGGYAEASWECPSPCAKGSAATGAAGDFLFRLGPEAAAAYRPTGTDTTYQVRDPGNWPKWGSGTDLHFGGYGPAALGANGHCDQGHTYAGAPNAACGGDHNWGATEMEVWYPVP